MTDTNQLPPLPPRGATILDTPVWDADQMRAYALQARAQVQGEPVFWYRPRSDGGYEGPIHNDGIERVRKLSGVWVPLYTASQPAQTAQPVEVTQDEVMRAAKNATAPEWQDVVDGWHMGLDLMAFARAILALRPQAAVPMTDAARDVLAERQRQVNAEGWTPEHDDEHTDGSMALAASCYACAGAGLDDARRDWPWDDAWFKPSTERRNLIKAGALILAEIERLDRAHGITAQASKKGGE